MSNLDDLDAARGGPFRYRLAGEIVTAPDPTEMSHRLILACLNLEFFPGLPDDIPLWKCLALFRRWAAHYDLPEPGAAQRLAYVVERYRDDLAYDLLTHANVDLGAAWRSRRWRTLLATIDRLPSHTYYAEAVSKDEEHTRLLAKHIAEAEPSDAPDGPPLRTWSPEVRLLTNIQDAVRRVEWAVIAAAAGKKAGNPPEPSPTPHTLLARETKRAEYERKMTKHKALAARLLPHKRAESDDPPG